jgi:Uma2 family endonuclease
MRTAAPPARFTAADLLLMPDGDRYELVVGQLVERKRGLWSSYVAGLVHGLLHSFCHGKGVGWALAGGIGYHCFPDAPQNVRKPDASLLRKARMPLDRAFEEGFVRVAPDLAVEVISPNDKAYEVDEKVQAYLRAGVRLVWVINPDARTVKVHRQTDVGVILRESDELTGEDVLPGFSCAVSELFLPPFEPASAGPVPSA